MRILDRVAYAENDPVVEWMSRRRRARRRDGRLGGPGNAKGQGAKRHVYSESGRWWRSLLDAGLCMGRSDSSVCNALRLGRTLDSERLSYERHAGVEYGDAEVPVVRGVARGLECPSCGGRLMPRGKQHARCAGCGGTWRTR